MLTKGAIGNLINRYRAVLKKCHLLNTFGSLAVASMLVLGGAGVADAADQWIPAPAGTTIWNVGSNKGPYTSYVAYIANNNNNGQFVIKDNTAAPEGPIGIWANSAVGSYENNGTIWLDYPTYASHSLAAMETNTAAPGEQGKYIINNKDGIIYINGCSTTKAKGMSVNQGVAINNGTIVVNHRASGMIDNSGYTNKSLINNGIIYVEESGTEGSGYGIGMYYRSGLADENNTIENNGQIYITGTGVGVQVSVLNGKFSNTGTISAIGANSEAVYLSSKNTQLDNSGTISATGANDKAAYMTGENAQLTNSGTISATGANSCAVYLNGKNAQVNNSGTISADDDATAIYIGKDNQQVANSSTGTIEGKVDIEKRKSDDSIIKNEGTVKISNSTISGNTIKTGAGSAVINNSGTLSFSGTNSFTGNTADSVAKDIHNTGTINVADGTTTIGGGISGGGSINLKTNGTLKLDADSGVDAVVIGDKVTNTAPSGTINLKGGTLELASDAVIHKGVVSDKGSITGSGVEDLTFDLGSASNIAALDVNGGGSMTVSGLGTLTVLGSSTSANAIFSQGELTISDVDKLVIGSKDPEAATPTWFTGIHGLSGSIDIDVNDEVFVRMTDNAVYAQQSSGQAGIITIDASKVDLYSESYSTVSSDTNGNHVSGADKNESVVAITATDTLKVVSGTNSAARSKDYGGNGGKSDIQLSGVNSVELSGGKYGIEIDRTNAGGKAVASVTVDSSAGYVTISGKQGGVYMAVDGAEDSATGSITAAAGTVSIASSDAFGVKLNNADLTIEGSKVTISGATNAIDVAGNSELAITGGANSAITGKLNIAGGETSITLGEGSKIAGYTKVASGAKLAITGASISGQSGSTAGGAVTNSGTLRLKDTDFTKNSAINYTASGSPKAYGGAIQNTGKLYIDGGLFEENKADAKRTNGLKPHGNGGAVYNSTGYLEVKNATFQKNDARLAGGAIYVNGGEAHFDNVTFADNYSGTGAGGALTLDDDDENGKNSIATIKNSTFSNNKTEDNGGAIYNEVDVTTSIENSTFENNIAKNGAIYNESSKPLTFAGDNTFTGNLVRTNGGAIYNEGTLEFNADADGKGTNTFSGNYAGVSITTTANADKSIVRKTFTTDITNAKANDIHNIGTINVNNGASLVIGGGISGGGTINLKTNGTLKLDADSGVDAVVIGDKVTNTAPSGTVNLKGGTLELASDAVIHKGVVSDAGSITGSGVEDLTFDLGSASNIAALDVNGGGSMTVSGLGTLTVLGSSTNANAIFSQGELTISDVDKLVIGSKETDTPQETWFTAIHGLGAHVNIQANEEVVVNLAKGNAVYSQAGSAMTGEVTIKAPVVDLYTYDSAAVCADIHNTHTGGEGKNESYINIEAETLKVVSGTNSAVRSKDIAGNGGKTDIQLSGTKSVELTGCKYGIEIDRTNAGGKAIASVTVDSSAGDVTISGKQGGVYMAVDGAEDSATGSITAAGTVTIASTDDFGVKLNNADLTIEGEKVSISGAATSAELLGDSTLTINGASELVGDVRVVDSTGSAVVNFGENGGSIAGQVNSYGSFTATSGKDITVDTDGKALMGSGIISLEAANGAITLDAGSRGIDMNGGQIKLNALNDVTITSESNDGIYFAPSLANPENDPHNRSFITIASTKGNVTITGGADDNFGVSTRGKFDVVAEAGDIAITGQGRSAMVNYLGGVGPATSTLKAGGDVTLSADILDKNTGTHYKEAVLYTQAGTTNITAGGDVTIADTGTRANKLAISVADGGSLSLNATGKSDITGNIKIAGKDSSLSIEAAGGTITGRSTVGAGAHLAITGKIAIDDQTAANYGGAIYNDGGTVELDGVSFSGNGIDNTGYAYGGAIYNLGGKVTIANSEFTDNYTKSTSKPRSGAVRNNGEMIITKTVFTGNYTENTGLTSKLDAMGGALYSDRNSVLTATDVTFTENKSSGEGGAISLNGAKATFSGENFFTDNKAGKNAGAIDIQGGSTVVFSGDNTFTGNKAEGKGGAISVGDAASTVSFTGDNTFTGNTDGTGANDIYNAGTITVAGGKTTIGGGISGSGATNIADGATLNLNADQDGGVVTVENSITNAGTIHVVDSAILKKSLSAGTSKITGDEDSSLAFNMSAPVDFALATTGNVTIDGVSSLSFAEENVTTGSILVGYGTTLTIDGADEITFGTDSVPVTNYGGIGNKGTVNITMSENGTLTSYATGDGNSLITSVDSETRPDASTTISAKDMSFTGEDAVVFYTRVSDFADANASLTLNATGTITANTTASQIVGLYNSNYGTAGQGAHGDITTDITAANVTLNAANAAAIRLNSVSHKDARKDTDSMLVKITATDTVDIYGGLQAAKITHAYADSSASVGGSITAKDIKLKSSTNADTYDAGAKTNTAVLLKNAHLNLSATNSLEIEGYKAIDLESSQLAINAANASITGSVTGDENSSITVTGGALTVAEGTVDGFLGSYIQETGSTTLTEDNKYFGGAVEIQSGELVADYDIMMDAGRVDAAITDEQVDGLNVAAKGSLNLDLMQDDGVTFGTYTRTDLANAKLALFDGDAGQLNIINANLVIDDERESIILGHVGGTIADGSEIAIAIEGQTYEEAEKLGASVMDKMVTIVSARDENPTFNSEKELSFAADITAKGLNVGDAEKLTLTDGAVVAFAATNADGLFVNVDANGNAVAVDLDVDVNKGASLTLGVAGQEGDRTALFGDLNNAGSFTATNTAIEAGSIASSGKTTITGGSVDTGSFTVSGGTTTLSGIGGEIGSFIAEAGDAIITGVKGVLGTLGIAGEEATVKLSGSDAGAATVAAGKLELTDKSTVASIEMSDAKAEVSLTNSTVTGDAIVSGGTFTAENGSVGGKLGVAEGAIAELSDTDLGALESAGTVTMTGGSVDGDTTVSGSFTATDTAIEADTIASTGTTSITGGSVDAGKFTVSSGTTTLSGIGGEIGSFIAEAGDTIITGVKSVLGTLGISGEDTTVTMNGGKVTKDVTVSGGFASITDAELAALKATGGETGLSKTTVADLAVSGEKTEVTLTNSTVTGDAIVSGGTFTAENGSVGGKLGVAEGAIAELSDTDLGALESAGTVTMNGGKVTKDVTVSGGFASITDAELAALKATGGETGLSKTTVASIEMSGEKTEVSLDGASKVTGKTTVAAGKLSATGAALANLAVSGGTATLTNGSVVAALGITGGKVTLDNSTLNDADVSVSDGSLTLKQANASALKQLALSGAASVDVVETNLELDTLTVNSGTMDITDAEKVAITTMAANGGETTITNSGVTIADLTIDGGAVSIIDSELVTIEHLTANKGTLFADPSTVIIKDLPGDNKLGTATVIGTGTAMVIGGSDINSAVAGAGDYLDTLSADTAALILGEHIDLGSTGSLLVKPGAAIGDALPGGNATFADGSLLAVDGHEAHIDEKNAIISGGGAGSTLSALGEAKLYIANVAANGTYVIADNFGTYEISDKAWSQDNGTLILNGLVDGDIKAVTNADGTVQIVTSTKVDEDSAFFDAIPTNALHELAEVGGAVESADMGKQFLSRAVDPTFMDKEAEAIATINEVSRAAVTAGVQNTSLRIADAASNTVVDHMSLSQHDGSKAIHSNGADFWAAPMYGNLYASGMNVAGSSVRGQFGGLALGVDTEGGQLFGGSLRFGAAINGGGGQSESKGTVTSTKNDYDFGGLNLYAGWNKGALNVIGSVGYGYGNHDVEMGQPSGMKMASAKADIDTTVFTADLRAEYQLKTNWLDILPHAGIRYTALQTDAHDLKVGGSVLNSVASDTQNIVQFPIGVTLSKDFDFSGWNVKPMADISVIPAAGEKKAFTKVNFSGMDAWDSVNSRIMDSTSWSGTIGVQAEKGNFSLGLNYGVQASSNETDQNIQLKLGWKF